MYDPLDEVLDSIDEDRRLKWASSEHVKRALNYERAKRMNKAKQHLKAALAKGKPLDTQQLDAFIENCERYPEFKKEMLKPVQDLCRGNNRRHRRGRAYLMQQHILEMTLDDVEPQGVPNMTHEERQKQAEEVRKKNEDDL